jgi:nucleoid-associated protein YgaU
MDPSDKKPSPPPSPPKKADFSNVQSGQSTTAPTPPPQAPPPRPEPKTYTVASGDTLWAIAKKLLGDGKRWPEIYEQNRAVIGDNPDRIKPGQILTIPDSSSSGGKR